MAKPEVTGLRDQLPSRIHRILGQKLYMTDLDSLHYSYNADEEIELHAIIDWKHGSAEEFSLNHSAMQARLALAKLAKLAFFVVYTYLDHSDYPVNMMYVIPCNEKAKSIGYRGWLSMREYSEFEHALRGLEPNPFELANLSTNKTVYPLANGVPLYHEVVR